MNTSNMLNSTTPGSRRAALRHQLQMKKGLRIMEAHSPLSALLVEKAEYFSPTSEKIEFDGFWSSSLTDSTLRGKPDTELVDVSSRLLNISDIFEVTTKPLIFDGDTGGKLEHLPYHIAQAEKIGISAFIMEDKTGLKKNSLFGNDVEQKQATTGEFCKKIAIAKSTQITPEFMVIARIESLILDAGMEDAVHRALAYVEAGADGIMIHSRKKDAGEIFEFAEIFRNHYTSVPLICVPTSYNDIHYEQLIDAGFNIVIYANHMLRAAYPAMKYVANEVLRYGRTQEVESNCMKIDEILELIPGTR
ncbi:phosphoenolpyruvate mutase [Acerihabitans sp. KWT182]|uniref:phosphoenolpyruvate mutase n=1 Tax=Acerihabitans sp. KWT182 TaxID=3157919 RepID=A0AAU7QDI3_9GAMM